MRRSVTAAVAAVTLAAPAGNAVAALRSTTATPPKKKRVVRVTRKVTGPLAQASRWGEIQVVLVVRKTTTIVGMRKRVVRRIASVGVPVYPDHTDRSVYINGQALPWLRQEVLQAQLASTNIDLISGATDTSYAFVQSLQSALLQAKKV